MLPDVQGREVVILAPVLALLLVLGLAPSLVTRDVDPAAARVIANVDPGGVTDVGEDVLAEVQPAPEGGEEP